MGWGWKRLPGCRGEKRAQTGCVTRHKTCPRVTDGNPRNARRRPSYPGGFGTMANGHARRPPGSFPSAHGDAPPLATLFRRVFCRSVSAISGARPFFPHSAAVPLERSVRARSARRLVVQQCTAPAVDTGQKLCRYVRQTPTSTAVRSRLFLKTKYFVQNFTLLHPPRPGTFSGFFFYLVFSV